MNRKKFNVFTKRTLANLFVVCIGIVLYLALSNFQSVQSALGNLYSVISPFVIGIALAYLLNMPMRFLERRLFSRFRRKRGLAIITTYLLAVFLVALLISSVLPQLFESVMRLVGNIPSYLNNLENLVTWVGDYFNVDLAALDSFVLNYADILTRAADFLSNLLPQLPNLGRQIGTGVIGAITALIASIYMLASKEKLLLQCRRVLYAILPQRYANGIYRVARLSNGVFSGFIGGKILDSAIIGLICFIFMSLMNLLGIMPMPYALLISVIIGVTNIIPFFGPFIGAIPSVLILLMVHPWSAFWFTIFIIVLQQFDGNVLGPKILGNSTGLPAMWVLVAIIVGGGLFGFAGMLLGVPTAAVLYTLASDIIARRLRRKRLKVGPDGTELLAEEEAEATEDVPGEVPPEPPGDEGDATDPAADEKDE